MINLLILIILNSLLCAGLYAAFSYEYLPPKSVGDKSVDNDTKGILWFWRFYVLERIPYRLSKPLGNCLTCMASVYSFLPYWYFYRWDFGNFDVVVCYPFYILTLAGINSIIDKYINE